MDLAVLTVSDRCSQGVAEDTAGPAVVAILHDNWHDAVIHSALVPDEESLIAEQLMQWAGQGIALILTVGGTGLGPRDCTPEATRHLLDREAPGLAEAIRVRGSEQNPYAWLSRGIAGLRGRTLIINLPGSRRGAEESLMAILALIRHGIEVVDGGQSHP